VVALPVARQLRGIMVKSSRKLWVLLKPAVLRNMKAGSVVFLSAAHPRYKFAEVGGVLVAGSLYSVVFCMMLLYFVFVLCLAISVYVAGWLLWTTTLPFTRPSSDAVVWPRRRRPPLRSCVAVSSEDLALRTLHARPSSGMGQG